MGRPQSFGDGRVGALRADIAERRGRQPLVQDAEGIRVGVAAVAPGVERARPGQAGREVALSDTQGQQHRSCASDIPSCPKNALLRSELCKGTFENQAGAERTPH